MGARADHYFNLLKQSYPPSVIESVVSGSFFHGIAAFAEAYELIVDQQQSQTFVDLATDIWLQELALQRGVAFETGISDADLREAIHQYDDRTTPNGMLEAVNELVDLYAIITDVTPDVDQGDALFFEPIHDGAYAHGTGTQGLGAFLTRGAAFANHIDCIAGPLGSASFEFILPGITIAGGSYAFATSSGDVEGAAFAHDTGAGVVDAFATNPRISAWLIINQITRFIQQMRAAGVPAWAQLRPSEKGLLANAYFDSLANWALGGVGAFSRIDNDPDTNPLESTSCEEFDQTGVGLRTVTSTDTFTVDDDSIMRVQVSAKQVVDTSAIAIGFQNGTDSLWWNPATLLFQAGKVTKDITNSLTLGERVTLDVFTNIELPSGGNPKVVIDINADDIYRIFQVGLHKES